MAEHHEQQTTQTKLPVNFEHFEKHRPAVRSYQGDPQSPSLRMFRDGEFEVFKVRSAAAAMLARRRPEEPRQEGTVAGGRALCRSLKWRRERVAEEVVSRA